MGQPVVRLSIRCGGAAALRRVLSTEVAGGVLLVKVPPPDGLEYGERVALSVSAGEPTRTVEVEVVSLLPDVGVAVSVAAVLPELDALLAEAPDGDDEVIHERPDPGRPALRAPAKGTVAERIRLALHGTRDDRAALLRDPDKSLHGIVLKSPKVTLDEVTAWANSPLSSVEILKGIADRKNWLSHPSVAQGLVRNAKTPPELALRALDHVGSEMLKQLVKGQGGSVRPFLVAAAKKKAGGR